MVARKALLVGSLPFTDEENAMTRALNILGEHLFCLPDGEIGEKTPGYPNGKRAAWVMTAINLCSADSANWETVRQAKNDANGFPTGYQTVQRLRPKRSPSEMHRYLDFGYHDYFRSSYPIFRRLRMERGLTDLKFQVGLPTGLGISFSMMHPINALRYADAFNRRLAYEVNEILKEAGDDVILQIELPGEVAMAYQLPDTLVGLALRSVWGLLKKIEIPAQIGVHLCLGDLNNIALIHPKTLDKMVRFSNALVDGWPAKHRLAYIHYPLAEAADPPTLDPAYYAPLRAIQLPFGTQFIAGFVHERRTLEEHQQLVGMIEQVYGQPVGVACSCGLGRRTTPVAEQLLNLMQQVADSTSGGWRIIGDASEARINTAQISDASSNA